MSSTVYFRRRVFNVFQASTVLKDSRTRRAFDGALLPRAAGLRCHSHGARVVNGRCIPWPAVAASCIMQTRVVDEEVDTPEGESTGTGVRAALHCTLPACRPLPVVVGLKERRGGSVCGLSLLAEAFVKAWGGLDGGVVGEKSRPVFKLRVRVVPYCWSVGGLGWGKLH